MNTNILLIIIIILIICLKYKDKKLEHMATVSPDEAIANVASLYNTGMAQVTNLKASQDITVGGKLTAPNITGPTTITGGAKIDTIKLGNKFILTGGKDFWADDDWLRLTNADMTAYGGGIAASKLYGNGEVYAGSLNVGANATVTGTTTSGNLRIGSWSIGQNGSGALVIKKDGVDDSYNYWVDGTTVAFGIKDKNGANRVSIHTTPAERTDRGIRDGHGWAGHTSGGDGGM